MDSGIYRIINSRRGSQSDEDSCSLHSQTLSEDERLKEFASHQEEDQPDHCCGSQGSEGEERKAFLLIADVKQLLSVASFFFLYKVLIIFIKLIEFPSRLIDLFTIRGMGLCLVGIFPSPV